MNDYYVYILSNLAKTLYVGATRDVQRRLYEHRAKLNPNSFTARYDITRLVHLEHFESWSDALARERQLKGWTRARKLALIDHNNKRWLDLSDSWND